MLDITLEFVKTNCANYEYVTFEEIFNVVEKELKAKWELEVEEKETTYENIRFNKVGELYRLLTVDSRFVRNVDGLWTIKLGFK
ncbi:DNA-directed RNA polymerase subunit delta [Mycoplasma sp. 1018B]|nr:hypothetical protein [Mycoplasma sp. 1018B]UUM19356.1 hypothetical protein NPA14_00560 [Mycoplasma sp. 1018B]